jgi:hypothetical protein
VTVGEQAAALQILQVFFETAQCPRAVRAKAENVAADFTGLGRAAVRFREKVWVKQPDEVGKAVVVAVMRGSRE